MSRLSSCLPDRVHAEHGGQRALCTSSCAAQQRTFDQLAAQRERAEIPTCSLRQAQLAQQALQRRLVPWRHRNLRPPAQASGEAW